jgi:hypothetical protein
MILISSSIATASEISPDKRSEVDRYAPYITLSASVRNVFDGKTGNIFVGSLMFSKPINDWLIWNIGVQQPFGDNYDFSPTLTSGFVFRIGTKRLTKGVFSNDGTVRVRSEDRSGSTRPDHSGVVF